MRPPPRKWVGSRTNVEGRKSKKDKKFHKTWWRRERSQNTDHPTFAHGVSVRDDTFRIIHLRRLAEEEPDHPDLRPWRFRWGQEALWGWTALPFDHVTRYEAACAGNIC